MSKQIQGLIVYLLLSCLTSPIQSQIYYPEILFNYDWRSCLMDVIGGIVMGNKVTTEHKKQFDEHLPRLVIAWQNSAPILFHEFFSFFHRGFSAKKRMALMYLSHNASYGDKHFLVLGLRNFFQPMPECCLSTIEDNFTSLVFHELLHIWLDENVSKKSPLLVKYNKEAFDTCDHIHLMAIQKMVYDKLQRFDILTMLDTSYRIHAAPTYKRAWEIVNDIEGYEVVLQDCLMSLLS